MRMIKNTGLAIIFLIVAISSKAAEIKFISEAYAGDDFSFYIIPNFLTENQVVVGNGTVDESGAFSCELDISEEITVFAEFDVFKGWFILKPNESIEIILPPKTPKTSTNPYFKLRQVHFGIKNPEPDNTNTLVDNFTRIYNNKMNKNFQEIFQRRSLETAEAVIAELKESYPETDNPYFENFKKYKYATLKYTAQIQEPEPVMDEYYINNPILYSHPDYAELFDKLFGKYLQYATQQVNGQKISVMLNSGAYEQLSDWLTIDMGFDKALAEAIILKGIKPIFYSKRFNTVLLFSILQKITDTSEVEEHKTTASYVFNQLARTMYGTIAPELDLIDINGGIATWEDYKGKYVYLCFTRTDNEKFVPHKNLMREFQKKYSDDLAIVVVVEDDKIDENKDILGCDDFEWTILRGQTRREIYESFNVRIMPTYFLVDPNGRMAGSQAPWPDENFEMQFDNILKATKME